MKFSVLFLVLFLGPAVRIVIFGAGLIVGYLISKNRREDDASTDTAVDEINEMLLEKDKRIDELEDYVRQLMEDGKITKRKRHSTDQSSQSKNDLTKIEGIGPKTEALLNDNGIYTYTQLASVSTDHLLDILSKAGSAYLRYNPETWPKKAQSAANEE